MQQIEGSDDNKNIITKLLSKVKFSVSDIILVIAVILMAVISFNLGKISVIRSSKTPITIQQNNNPPESDLTANLSDKITPQAKDYTNTPVYASKNSTGKLYHFPWCSGASQIAEKNKLTFQNETAAKTAGYSLAGNCKR